MSYEFPSLDCYSKDIMLIMEVQNLSYELLIITIIKRFNVCSLSVTFEQDFKEVNKDIRSSVTN